MPDTVVSGNKNIPAGTRLVQASDGDQRLTAGENAAVIAIQREDTTKRIVSFELDAAKPRLNIYAPSVEIPGRGTSGLKASAADAVCRQGIQVLQC